MTVVLRDKKPKKVGNHYKLYDSILHEEEMDFSLHALQRKDYKTHSISKKTIVPAHNIQTFVLLQEQNVGII